MLNLVELRQNAREIFNSALRAVDAYKATRRSITLETSFLRIEDSRFQVSQSPIYVVGIGKASLSMAQGVDEQLSGRLTRGVITCPEQPHSLPPTWQVFFGGHPLPNEASLAAARAVFDLLERAKAERAVVVFLISGGGSAMIEWPSHDDISLADLREANRLLVACGASISEINAVRRAFSAIKGGALARRAPQARIVTLVVSDTNPGDEANVASGPTLLPPPDAPYPLEVIRHYKLQSVLPATVLQTLQGDRSVIRGQQSMDPYYVLLDNRTAIEAAADKAKTFGFAFAVPKEICEQPIQEGSELLLSHLDSLPPRSEGVCLVSGGEFSCPVRGHGRGGRNLETVLRCAIDIDENKRENTRHTVVLSAGTDGIDGNSPAAGAIADETTIDRARALGLEPNEFLARSDSYGFFERLDDLIVTGPTGTNVRDVRILLRA
jgi:glycerate 2-kinase